MLIRSLIMMVKHYKPVLFQILELHLIIFAVRNFRKKARKKFRVRSRGVHRQIRRRRDSDKRYSKEFQVSPLTSV